jgi:integrase/recombinase XerD
MGLSRQAKTLSRQQIEAVSSYLLNRRHGLRDQTIFNLSIRSGLRAKEIASLTWAMVTTSDGKIGDAIHLTNIASKGKSGRIIPMNKAVKENLGRLLLEQQKIRHFDITSAYVISTERAKQTSAQSIVNMFSKWYRELGLLGCSSHSGRRTFITNAARKISTVGGSLRDVQMLAGHSSLAVTQRYIEGDSEAQRRVVQLTL